MREVSNGKFAAQFICFFSFLSVLLAQTTDIAAIREYIEAARQDWRVPGIAVAVVQDDSLVMAEGFGVCHILTGERVNANTVFAIASNSKAFTATAIGLLVQEGKLSWDDPIINFLPDFQMYDPLATRKVTLRHMLAHKSGLGLWAGDLNWFNASVPREEIIRKIRYLKPVYDLGTGYAYSNLGFLTAGQVIPAVTDTSWDNFIVERFFKPLGMKRSNTSIRFLKDMDNVATPHLLHDGELLPYVYDNVDGAGPAAGINSTARDLGQWLRLQLAYGHWQGRQMVDSSIIFATRRPQNLLTFSRKSLKFHHASHLISFGLGWIVKDYHGRLMVLHGGALTGMFSQVAFVPEEQLGVVVLTNLEDHNLQNALAHYLIDQFMGVETTDWSARYLQSDRENRDRLQAQRVAIEAARDRQSQPSKALAGYTGEYVANVNGPAFIKLEDDLLVITLALHPHIRGVITHWQYDTFKVKWNDKVWNENLVYFDLDDNGEVRQFRLQIRPDWVETWEYTFVKRDGGK
jgi:CubicO group peptidase (beta-lactamase class C family)